MYVLKDDTHEHPTVPFAPQGPFRTPDEAAIAWANHIYSTSLFVRHEHGAMIYRTAPGEYRISRTISGSPHDVSVPLIGIPAHQRIAFVHTHPNTMGFTPDDKQLARTQGINAYVATPSDSSWVFHLWRYHRPTPSQAEDERVIRNVDLKPLSTAEQAILMNLYQDSWDNHLPCIHPFGCNNMQWPTSPWPPR